MMDVWQAPDGTIVTVDAQGSAWRCGCTWSLLAHRWRERAGGD